MRHRAMTTDAMLSPAPPSLISLVERIALDSAGTLVGTVGYRGAPGSSYQFRGGSISRSTLRR